MDLLRIKAYVRRGSAAIVMLTIGCLDASPETLEYNELDLDGLGGMDRRDVIEATQQHHGDMVFIRGRIKVNRVLYPEASSEAYVGFGDGRVFPCENNPFDVPPEEYPTHERVRAGLVPNPWFFNWKLVSGSDGTAFSTSLDIKYGSLPPMEKVSLSDVHGKCVTLLVKVTGERDIASITSVGTLYVHNIYDTESSLEEE